MAERREQAPPTPDVASGGLLQLPDPGHSSGHLSARETRPPLVSSESSVVLLTLSLV